MDSTFASHPIELSDTLGSPLNDSDSRHYHSSTTLTSGCHHDSSPSPTISELLGCKSLPNSWSCRRLFLLLVDNIISGLIIGPLTVFFWRGTWTLLERHLLPVYDAGSNGQCCVLSSSSTNGWICLAIGNIGLLIVVYSQRFLGRHLDVNRVVHWLTGCHVYTYVVAFFNVCHWRGVWTLLNVYTGTGEVSSWTSLAIGLGGLWLLRSSRNAVAPPMVVVIDIVPNIFEYTTRFATKPEDSEYHLLDSILTVFIVHQLVVFYWRGSWLVLDFYLFPYDKTFSAVVCLAIGYVLQTLLCIAQPFLNVFYMTRVNADDRDTAAGTCFCRRWILETIVYFFGNLVCVVHWRGVWMLLDVYVMPSQPDAAAAVEHVVGIVGLWLILAGHSVTLMGCSLDGGSEPQDGCLIRNQYIRYLINRYQSCGSDVTVIT